MLWLVKLGLVRAGVCGFVWGWLGSTELYLRVFSIIFFAFGHVLSFPCKSLFVFLGRGSGANALHVDVVVALDAVVAAVHLCGFVVGFGLVVCLLNGPCQKLLLVSSASPPRR